MKSKKMKKTLLNNHLKKKLRSDTTTNSDKTSNADNNNKWGMSTFVHDKTLHVVRPKDIKAVSNIVAFDLDSTLIEPKGKEKFPVNRNDWKWWHITVPKKLKELHDKGSRIVIFFLAIKQVLKPVNNMQVI